MTAVDDGGRPATDPSDLAERVWLKSRLLTEGCSFGDDFAPPVGIHGKKIHLYAHSPEARASAVPDDIVLGGPDSPTAARVRYRAGAPLHVAVVDGRHVLRDLATDQSWDVSFLPLAAFTGHDCGGVTVDAVCSFLGRDVLGVVPSNHCFYFRTGDECRFCEIQATHATDVEYPQTAKRRNVVAEAITAALDVEPRIGHLAITTGNVKDYDHTARMLADLVHRVADRLERSPVEDVLATLMPPDDLGLMGELRTAGFTKIYFSLEIFDPRLFEVICPGKAAYGYDRMLAALDAALDVFGPGNVYTNFVYGIQSLDGVDGGRRIDPAREAEVALEATDAMLARQVIPAFTLYHHAGANPIGPVDLDAATVHAFACEWGRRVDAAGLVPPHRSGVLFGLGSLTNTLFNDGYALARAGAARRGPRRGDEEESR